MIEMTLRVLTDAEHAQEAEEVLCGIGKIMEQQHIITNYSIHKYKHRDKPARRGPYTEHDDVHRPKEGDCGC